jgi:hypothetical protein
MNTKHVINENSLNHHTTGHAQQAHGAARHKWTLAKPPATRPCRQLREQLRSIRSAELAFWEATGGDVLNAHAASLYSLSTAGTPRHQRG